MQNDRPISRLSNDSAAELLGGLSSADAGAAWVKFLDQYSALIMNAASQFDYEQDRVYECFLYICEHLSDNGFRRLLKFNTAGKAKFSTWLGSVVFNLCVDWHRKEFGRAKLLPAISALPAFDQSVFHLVIEQGMGKEACFQTLRADFPDLTCELVEKAASRVFSLMTPRQRWQLGVRNRGRRPSRGTADQDFVEHLPDPGPGPEKEAQTRQDFEALQIAISRLPAQQRLLLRLRYQEGLRLKKIARMQNFKNTSQAWRMIQSATSALFDKIQNWDSVKKRKK